MEAASGGPQVERVREGLQPAPRGPFIEVPGDDGRPPHGLEMPHERGGLPPPVAAAQAQMGRGEGHVGSPRPQAGQDGAARLQPRQVDPLPIEQVDAGRQQDRVAVAPEAALRARRDDAPSVPLQQAEWQGGRSPAEAQVGLLHGDDVGPHVVQHTQDAGRVSPPVEPEGLADVVTRDPHQPVRLRLVLRRRVIGGIWACFGLLALAALVLGRGQLAVVAGLAAFLSAAPVLFAARLRIVLPLPFVLSLAVFLAASLIAGEAFGAYERVWWWDLALHGASAVGMGMAGVLYVLMLFEGDRYAAPPWALTAIAVCLAVTAGTLWELFEYAMDQALGLSMQKSGLPDTMGDLAVNVAGAVIGGASGALYLVSRRMGPAARLIAQFVRLNASRFHRR